MPKHPSISQAQRYTCVIAVILSLSEVILLYSRCAKKGLVYIAIAAPSIHQPSFYFKCTSVNMHLFCNIRLVSNVKYKLYLYPPVGGNT